MTLFGQNGSNINCCPQVKSSHRSPEIEVVSEDQYMVGWTIKKSLRSS